jgi:hypothetical protein
MNTYGMFECTFEEFKSAFSTQKIYLKKKRICGPKKLKAFLRVKKNGSQKVVQSARTTPNEADVTSSNPSLPSCVNISKKKNKKKKLKKWPKNVFFFFFLLKSSIFQT